MTQNPAPRMFAPRTFEVAYKFYTNETRESRFFKHRPTDDMKLAHAGTILCVSHMDALNQLFEIFNINHPEGYSNRSMSVADVIMIQDDLQTTWYTCEGFGWAVVDEPLNHN